MSSSATPLTAEQFAAFCAKHKHRYAFDEPFVRAGWNYATDGRACLRIPTDEPDTEGRDLPTGNGIAGIFTPEREDRRPWPKHSGEHDSESCGACNGSGRHECTCEFCEHNGEKCQDCEGAGTWREPVPIRLKDGSGRSIAGRYAVLIEALPGVAIVGRREGERCILFAFEGGEGAVMLTETE